MKNLPAKFLALCSVIFAAVVVASCIFVEHNVEENNYAGTPTIGSNWVANPLISSVACDENIACCLLVPENLENIYILNNDPTLKSEFAGSAGASGGSAGAGGLQRLSPLLF